MVLLSQCQSPDFTPGHLKCISVHRASTNELARMSTSPHLKGVARHSPSLKVHAISTDMIITTRQITPGEKAFFHFSRQGYLFTFLSDAATAICMFVTAAHGCTYQRGPGVPNTATSLLHGTGCSGDVMLNTLEILLFLFPSHSHQQAKPSNTVSFTAFRHSFPGTQKYSQ